MSEHSSANSNNEKGQTKYGLMDFLTLAKYEVMSMLIRFAKRVLGREKKVEFEIKSRYSVMQAKSTVVGEGLAFINGEISWFYTAFERGDHDPLTNYALEYIERNMPKSSRILVTGCGTGITVFHLSDCGFHKVVGRDVLVKCIVIANRLKEKFSYHNTVFEVDDCFNPKTVDGKFQVILAIHWVFSAWMGNYGNEKVDESRDPAVREKLLNELFAVYAPYLEKNGIMIIELTDAVADYRIVTDIPLALRSLDVYSVRHTPEQVEKCAAANGLEIVEKKLCVSYGHQPRTSYILRKS